MNRLVIFAKYPEPGKVKTRLAKRIGAAKAAVAYRAMAETVVGQTLPEHSEYYRLLYFDPPERQHDVAKWLPDIELRSQKGDDLGKRMLAAFRDGSPDDRTIIIGTDCVAVDTALVCEAFAALNDADLVLGPTDDGGYYLIGGGALPDTLFCDMPWSTHGVRHETLRRAAAFPLRVHQLRTLADVDE